MSFPTSLLLFLTGFALLIVAIRARPKARLKRLEDWEEYKMELGARVCRAAARNAFRVDLDHSDQSLPVLDEIMTTGWGHDAAHKDLASKDSVFTMASYLGDVLRRHHGAEWQLERTKHKLPYLYFKTSDLAASPFDIIEKKLEAPNTFSLAGATQRLLLEVEKRKHIRATTWHSQGESHISFGDPVPHDANAISVTSPSTTYDASASSEKKAESSDDLPPEGPV